MTKQYSPEVVDIGGYHVQTRPKLDEYGEWMKWCDHQDLVTVVRDCILDLDHSGTHPSIKRKLEAALAKLGEDI